jgi:hypothetical protein
MESTAVEQRRFRSLRILFGTDLNPSREFLDYLQLSGLKSAYRRRAMETHPDRISAMEALPGRQDDVSFPAVCEAYEDLLDYLRRREARKPGRDLGRSGVADRNKKPAPDFQVRGNQRQGEDDGLRHTRFRRPFSPIILPAGAEKRTAHGAIETLYRGAMPYRPLLFGHYLYYYGLTNWRTISRVLIWQRLGRPRIGELGLRAGVFSCEDIGLILRNKTPKQSFGQTARDLGLVTDRQLQSLIVLQRNLQKKFGAILVERHLVRPCELQELLFQFTTHNDTWRSAGAATAAMRRRYHSGEDIGL